MPSKTSKTIKVELASTPQERTVGLMYRKSIDPNSGMLFLFQKKSSLSFWGANTYIPLDIAFIDGEKIIDIKKIVPLSTRAIKCDAQCDKALEVPCDFFEKNKIEVGSSVKVDGDEVTFIL